MIQPDEAVDHQMYRRGWGYERYYPRLGMADFLARLPDCAAAHRELKRSIASAELRKPLLQRCAPQSVLRLDPSLHAIPPEFLGGAGAAEALPPFAPRVAWSDIGY